MDITTWTIVVAVGGLLLIGLIGILQLAAVLRPRSAWVIENVYGGSPDRTDAKAYFAFNSGFAWADVLLWVPLQVAGSIGMLCGERYGFLLGLAAAVPYCYTAVPMFIWDRDLGFRRNTVTYWVFVWGMFPAYGLVQGLYCFARLLA